MFDQKLLRLVGMVKIDQINTKINKINKISSKYIDVVLMRVSVSSCIHFKVYETILRAIESFEK